MTIEEQFKDYQARLTACGAIAKPADYFKAGYLFGAYAENKEHLASRKRDSVRAAQISIAFGKYCDGYRPGDEEWGPEDQEALELVRGCNNE